MGPVHATEGWAANPAPAEPVDGITAIRLDAAVRQEPERLQAMFFPERVPFHLGTEQITGFAGNEMHLLVIHSPRPFRPGIREKVQTFFEELVRLSRLASR